jgi:hypothetical protein
VKGSIPLTAEFSLGRELRVRVRSEELVIDEVDHSQTVRDLRDN